MSNRFWFVFSLNTYVFPISTQQYYYRDFFRDSQTYVWVCIILNFCSMRSIIILNKIVRAVLGVHDGEGFQYQIVEVVHKKKWLFIFTTDQVSLELRSRRPNRSRAFYTRTDKVLYVYWTYMKPKWPFGALDGNSLRKYNNDFPMERKMRVWTKSSSKFF